MHWYAVHTLSGKENRVRECMLADFPELKTLFPQRKLALRMSGKNIIKQCPLFPGYFFIGSEHEAFSFEDLNRLKYAGRLNGLNRDCIRVLGGEYKAEEEGQEVQSISPDEMEHILFLTNGGEKETVDFSFYKKEGQKVRITEGPLAGLESIIKRVNPRKKRITISLKVFGVEKDIDLGGEMVECIIQ